MYVSAIYPLKRGGIELLKGFDVLVGNNIIMYNINNTALENSFDRVMY